MPNLFRLYYHPAFAFAALALTVAPRISRADSAADALLAKAAAALNSAQTLAADFTITTLRPTRYSDTLERGTLTLAKPNRARIEITRYRKPVDADRWIASGNGSVADADGATAWTLINHPQSAQYRAVKATADTPARLLESLPLLQTFFAAPVQGHAEARLLGTKTWENAPYSVVEETFAGKDGAAPTVRESYIGADGLIYRVVVRSQIRNKNSVTEIALRRLRLNKPVASKTFAFTPPANAVPFERTPPQSLLAAGTEAPDFEAVDASGKTVRLSDFRGKIVALKFFATWCWTCRQSLPQTDALAKKYADRDVVTLAVDIWNSRKAFNAWTAATPYRAIRFVHDDRPQGQDAASLLYHVAATPTEYLIDRDGKIVASFVGYEGPNAELERALEAAATRRQASASR